jgi:hypothetical protein
MASFCGGLRSFGRCRSRHGHKTHSTNERARATPDADGARRISSPTPAPLRCAIRPARHFAAEGRLRSRRSGAAIVMLGSQPKGLRFETALRRVELVDDEHLPAWAIAFAFAVSDDDDHRRIAITGITMFGPAADPHSRVEVPGVLICQRHRPPGQRHSCGARRRISRSRSMERSECASQV